MASARARLEANARTHELGLVIKHACMVPKTCMHAWSAQIALKKACNEASCFRCVETKLHALLLIPMSSHEAPDRNPNV